ncbi:hypothetical protein [Methylocystis sp. SB2]|uniref:hypothetical protein n=1 Tax=Methylocystis sp. (strain SB2) TaxID=743836 RepID=UPI00351D4750
MRKLQNDRLSVLHIRRPHQPTVAPFRKKAVHSKLVDKISDRRQLANRQGCKGARQGALVGRRHIDDVNDKRSDIIVAARLERRLNDSLRGFLRPAPFGEQRTKLGVWQHPMNAVRTQQKSIMHTETMHALVEQKRIVEADRAKERMGEIAAT